MMTEYSINLAFALPMSLQSRGLSDLSAISVAAKTARVTPAGLALGSPDPETCTARQKFDVHADGTTTKMDINGSRCEYHRILFDPSNPLPMWVGRSFRSYHITSRPMPKTTQFVFLHLYLKFLIIV